MAMVCHCRRVNDRRLVAEIEQGASTIEEIIDVCGAGGRCGGCHESIAALLERLVPAVPLTLGGRAA